MSQRTTLLQELHDVQILVYPAAAKVFSETEYAVKRLSACQPCISRSSSREQLHKVEKEEYSRQDQARDDKAYEEVTAILKRLIGYLVESPSNDVEVVAKNQAIMLNLGLDVPVRRLLGLHLHRDSSRRDSGVMDADIACSTRLRDLFQCCYDLLRALAKGNPKVQRALFPHLKTFAEHVGIEKLNAADTMTEVIRDNPRLSSRAGEVFLSKFITAIKTWGRRARWLTFYHAFLLVKGQVPVKRNQDLILRLLLDDKDAVLDLTCDYSKSKFLSESDDRYGKTRIELLLENDHRRPVFSLLKYHVECLKTLAMCAAGRSAENIIKIAGIVPFSLALDSFLDVDLPLDAHVREQRINPDAIRFVQVGWASLISDVYFSCNPQDAHIVGEVLASKRIYSKDEKATGSPHTLLSVFANTFEVLKVRLEKLDPVKYRESEHLLNNLEDGYGHNLGTHFELAQVLTRACKQFLSPQKRECFTLDHGRDLVGSPAAKNLRDSVVLLYPVIEAFRFSRFAKILAELISSMNEAGIAGQALVSVDNHEKRMKPPPTLQQTFRNGWQYFRSYLHLALDVDQRDGHSMDKAIFHIALLLGGRSTYMNDDHQALKELLRLMMSRECDETLKLHGLHVLRAILYLQPGRLSAEQQEAEYALCLNNEFSSCVGEAGMIELQERMAELGMVDVVTRCFQDSDPEIVMATLKLAVTLLDGGSKCVQQYFAMSLLPASSAPFFMKLDSLFVETEEARKEEKRRQKQQEKEKAALKKAGIRSSSANTHQSQAAEQTHITEVLKMMRRFCSSRGPLQDVLRIQRLNASSINFFMKAVQVGPCLSLLSRPRARSLSRARSVASSLNCFIEALQVRLMPCRAFPEASSSCSPSIFALYTSTSCVLCLHGGISRDTRNASQLEIPEMLGRSRYQKC